MAESLLTIRKIGSAFFKKQWKRKERDNNIQNQKHSFNKVMCQIICYIMPEALMYV